MSEIFTILARHSGWTNKRSRELRDRFGYADAADLPIDDAMSRPKVQFWITGYVGPIVLILLSAAMVSCAVGPTQEDSPARPTAAQVAELGAAAFYEISSETPRSKDAEVAAYASCVGANLERALEGATRTVGRFEVAVFEVEEAGSFALPGGKVGIYTGLLPLVRNQDQLAAVFAHDLAHIVAHHPRDRLAEATGARLGRAEHGAVIDTAPGTRSPESTLARAALGYGPELETTLPYTFEQESEADVLGLELMARAGFDPRQGVEMWKNLRRAPGTQRPEFFRRHAHNERRIHRLYDVMGRSIEIHQTARDMGREPTCKSPDRE